MRSLMAGVLLSLLAACASVTTNGSIPDEDYPHDLKSAYIVFTDFVHKGQYDWLWKDHPGTTASAEALMKEIGVQAERLWPEKFAEHGIRAEVALLSKQTQNAFSMILIDAPRSNPDYLLEVSLRDVAAGTFGALNVSYDIVMWDRRITTGIKLWEGSVVVHKGMFPSSTVDLSIEIAERMLAQMKLDGVTK